MTNDEPPPRRGGPRPGATTPTVTTLGSVRVTGDEVGAYNAAAERAGTSRSDWIRNTLNAAAARSAKRSKR